MFLRKERQIKALVPYLQRSNSKGYKTEVYGHILSKGGMETYKGTNVDVKPRAILN